MAHRATAAVAGADGAVLSDAELVTLMSESNGLEIASGERALTKATDPAVRRFAQPMIDDHTKLQQAVDEVVARQNVQPATRPDSMPAAMQRCGGCSTS